MRTALVIIGGLAAGAWAVASWAAGAAAAEVEISAFFGSWQGVEVAADGAQSSLGLMPADLSIVVSKKSDGFRLEGLAIGRRAPDSVELARRPMAANFAPTEVPGVYAFDPGGSLFSTLFADPATGNPLDGDTLLWARLEGGTLHLYSLSINPVGGFDLEHGRGTLEGDAMSIDFVGYMEGDQVFTVKGRLERAGG